jgi:hypothetical protein
MAIHTVDITKGESRMAMGSITGHQERLMLESSRRAFVKDKEDGSVRLVMSIRGTTAQTARTDGENSNGLMETYTAGNSAKI